MNREHVLEETREFLTRHNVPFGELTCEIALYLISELKETNVSDQLKSLEEQNEYYVMFEKIRSLSERLKFISHR